MALKRYHISGHAAGMHPNSWACPNFVIEIWATDFDEALALGRLEARTELERLNPRFRVEVTKLELQDELP